MFSSTLDTVSCIPDYVLFDSRDFSKVYYPFMIYGFTSIAYIELEVVNNSCSFTSKDLYKLSKVYYREHSDSITFIGYNIDFLTVLFDEFKDEIFKLSLGAGSKICYCADDISSYWSVNNAKSKILKNIDVSYLTTELRGVVIEVSINGQKHYLHVHTKKTLDCCIPVLELQFDDLGTKFNNNMYPCYELFTKGISIPNGDMSYLSLMLCPSKRVFQDIVEDVFEVTKVISLTACYNYSSLASWKIVQEY